MLKCLPMHQLIKQHSSEILHLAKARGIHNVRLFGSMRRDDASPESDIDLLVELPAERSGLVLGGFLLDVSDLLGRKVDVVTEKSLHPRIREKVLQEALSL